jgi:hypothetical protein
MLYAIHFSSEMAYRINISKNLEALKTVKACIKVTFIFKYIKPMAYASTSSLPGTVLKMVKKTMIFVTFLPPYNL